MNAYIIEQMNHKLSAPKVASTKSVTIEQLERRISIALSHLSAAEGSRYLYTCIDAVRDAKMALRGGMDGEA